MLRGNVGAKGLRDMCPRPRLPNERAQLLAGRPFGLRLYRDGFNIVSDVFHRLREPGRSQARVGGSHRSVRRFGTRPGDALCRHARLPGCASDVL